MRTNTKHFLLTLFTAVICLTGYNWIDEAMANDKDEWHKGLPKQFKSKWRVHDLDRPQPKKVTPGAQVGMPPSDAIVLFDGKDLSKWTGDKGGMWKIQHGYAELNDTGGITSREEFGDCQLHLEYMAPIPPQKDDQYRGNSGIFFMGKYEVQVLDNYDNPTYADGYIGSVYGQHPPLVFAGRKPGEWQSYDIIFRRPRFKDGKLLEPARVTILLNGVLVQHNAEVYGSTNWRKLAKYKPHGDTGPISLQDHGDGQKPKFRNIWLRELDLSAEAIDNRN